MSQTVYTHVHQAENVVFSDLDALNKELLTSNLGVYITESDIPNDAFIIQPNPNEILIAELCDNEFIQYSSGWSAVWLDKNDASLISKYLTHGKLVFRFDIEGNDSEFYILEAGQYPIYKTIKDVKF